MADRGRAGAVTPPPLENAPPTPPGKRGKVKILRPLRHRDFSLLWSGMTVSLLGDGIYFVAIAWLVLRLSNSPTALGIVGVAWTLPQVLSLLWAGAASDRWDRRRVMIAADLVRALPIGLIALLTYADAVELWHLFVLVAIYGVGEGLFMPAFSAIVPDVVPSDELVEANSMDQFVRPLTLRFAGPAVGGVVIAATGVATAFLIDALTFLVSAFALTLMRKSSGRPRANDGDTSMWTEIGEGLAYVRRHTWLWISLAVTAIGLLAFYGPFQVLVPFLVKNPLGGDARDLGIVMATGGVGAVAASVLMGQVGLPRKHITFIYVTWALGTLALAGYAASRELWHVAVVTLVMEILLTAGLIVWATLIQTKVPNRLLGRVSSLDWLVSTSLIPLSYGLTGPLARVIGLRATLTWAGVAGALAILAALLVPRVHDVEKEGGLGG